MSCASWLPLVEEYLTVRRGLGYASEQPAWLLRDFARYADMIGHYGPLTTELALGWALASRSSSPAQALRRLGTVRQFARHRALVDPATEVPPPGLLGRLPRRPPPHIYSDAELAALLDQVSRLRPRRVCARGPMWRSSRCWPAPGCGSLRPAGSRSMTST
jgi:integrase/recombinase XerC